MSSQDELFAQLRSILVSLQANEATRSLGEDLRRAVVASAHSHAFMRAVGAFPEMSDDSFLLAQDLHRLQLERREVASPHDEARSGREERRRSAPAADSNPLERPRVRCPPPSGRNRAERQRDLRR